MQFARVAHATDFLYCYSIMEANRRSDFAPNTTLVHTTAARGQTMRVAVLGHSMHPELNTFFPFDPYKLPRSSAYIEGVYREWSMVAIDNEEEDEDEEDEDEQLEEEGQKQVSEKESLTVVGAIPVQARGPTTDSLDVSFGGMSISPMRPPNLSVSVAMSVS